jgi:hypothetical protein
MPDLGSKPVTENGVMVAGQGIELGSLSVVTPRTPKNIQPFNVTPE